MSWVSLACNAVAARVVWCPDQVAVGGGPGRGTSTFDGNAIAYAVVKHLTDVIGARTMFATHYHSLCEEFCTHPRVGLAHMVPPRVLL
jgi:acetylornithine/succinyldiaminopimelate/putrescine aminotransferase